MQSPAASKSSGFSLEAVLLLGAAFLTSRLLVSDFLDSFLVRDGHMLLPSITLFVAFVVFVWLGHRPSPTTTRHQFWVVTVACVIVIAMMGVKQIKHRSLPPDVTGIHDGAVQTEIAANFLLHGRNPYGADYVPTDFGKFPNSFGPWDTNPAWTHYAYPPANFLLTIPFLWIHQLGQPWVDSRTLYTLAFLVIVTILVVIQTSWTLRTRLVILTLGNPLLWTYSILGFNDSLFLAGLIISAWAIMTRRWAWAGIAFGLALGAKQTAWLVIPLWLGWLWWMYQRRQLDRRALKKSLIGAAATAGSIILPFFFWNPSAFYTDVVRYVSGTLPQTFPVSGTTFQQFLVIWHLIPSAHSASPSTLIEIIVGLPLLWLTLSWLRRDPSPSQWLGSIVVLVLGILLVSRFFNENYASALALLAISAYAFSGPRSEPRATSH